MYVNYGRTEDFFQLEREMGVNVTGRIVIVRYGKIFRGNKVRKDGPGYLPTLMFDGTSHFYNFHCG